MSPAILVLILCITASALAAVHRMACDQSLENTSTCDIALGVPMIFLLAVACGVSGLAVLATSHET